MSTAASPKQAVEPKKISYIGASQWLISLAIPMLIFMMAPFDYTMLAYLAITVGAILFWVFALIPEPITGLLIPILFCLVGVSKPETAFKAWSSIMPWLVLAGMIMGEVMLNTGLAKRIAYRLLLVAGCSGTGLLVSCLLLSVLLPLIIPAAVWAKMLVLAPVGIAICHALGFKAQSREATGIMLMLLFTSLSSGYQYITGDETMIWVASMISDVTKGQVVLNFVEWMKVMWLPGFVWVAMSIIIPYFLLVRPSTKNAPDSTHIIKEKYQELGPIQGIEVKAMTIIMLILLNFFFEERHGLNSAHVMVILTSLFFLPGINLMDFEKLKQMNIWIIFFVAGALTIGQTSNAIGFNDIVAKNLLPAMQGAGSYGAVLIFYTFGVFVKFFMTPLAAIAAFTPLVGDVAIQLGVSPVAAMQIYNFSVDMYLFPYEVAPVLYFFSLGYMSYKESIKIFCWRLLASYCIVAIIISGYWKMIGLI